MFNNVSSDLTYESYTYCDFYHTYLNKFSQCYLSSQFRTLGPSFWASKTNFVYLNEVDMQTGDFLVPGPNNTISFQTPLFRVLIIPDIIGAASQTILSALGSAGLNTIRQFVTNGGMVYSSAKGAMIVEAAELLETGTVDTSTNNLHLQTLISQLADQLLQVEIVLVHSDRFFIEQ